MTDFLNNGISTLVNNCGQIKPNDDVVIITSLSTSEIGLLVLKEVTKTCSRATLEVVPEPKIHGEEPPQTVAQRMKYATLIFCLTPMSLAHTKARKNATENGARYLSLPDYSFELLKSKSLTTDFVSLIPVCNMLGDDLDKATNIIVETELGTSFQFSVEGRAANRCPGVVTLPGDLGSPPDAEVNIAPLEGYGNGILVIDGSIPCPGLGVLESPVKLVIKDSVVTDVSCENKVTEKSVQDLFDEAGPKSRIIGEFGIGLNDNAELCGIMLEDEGCAGTIHFGIGSNATIGGTNDVSFHVDFIIRSPTVTVDGSVLLEHGQLIAKYKDAK